MDSKSKPVPSSRIPSFFKLNIPERIQALRKQGWLEEADLQALDNGSHTLQSRVADSMIENVVGVLGLPLGLGLNFLINGKDYVVPLAVEEPSIVAGLSGAARIARLNGGFTATCTDPILTGQVQVVHVEDAELARQQLLEHRQDILSLANSLQPKMVARGGGAKDLEVFIHDLGDLGDPMVVLHLHVDTQDAMGANVVNGMCEGIASLVESIANGQVFLRILSNLTDRSVVTAKVTIPVENLKVRNFAGEQVRDGIVLANQLALVDPYRAATHNKGIMNGIDAVALATGNDFRALEAAAHAYAARDGRYRGLSNWVADEDGNLCGTLEIPIKVGIVGGSLQTNPTVRISQRLVGVKSATELAEVMGCVGLGQNFAALRSLATAGIQQNHMTLHARSVATSAKVPPEMFDQVVEALIEDGSIKIWKAEDIVKSIRQKEESEEHHGSRSAAYGKAILLGEHAVVYGRPALAVPVPIAVEARIVDSEQSTLIVPRWGVEQRIPPTSEHPQGVVGLIATVLEELDLHNKPITMEIFPKVPRAMGLGGSAAMAVAVVRALSEHFDLNLSDEKINAFAYECEKSAHISPSGVDNTIATYGKPMVFRPGTDSSEPSYQFVKPGQPLHLLIGISGRESLTANMIARVAEGREKNRKTYEKIFDEIADLAESSVVAFEEGNLARLGALMNVCHGFLNAMHLSTPELESLIHIARDNGALGAKLTGAGGGGSMIALFEEPPTLAVESIQNAGYSALSFVVG